MAEDYEHLVDFTLGALCSCKEGFRFTQFFKGTPAIYHEPSPYLSKGTLLECTTVCHNHNNNLLSCVLLHYSFECMHITRFLQNTDSLLMHVHTLSPFTNTTIIINSFLYPMGTKGPFEGLGAADPEGLEPKYYSILFFISNNFSNFLFLLSYLQ
jgi:hypothetical protein